MEPLVLIANRENRFKYRDFIAELEREYEILKPLGFGQQAVHLVIGGDECLHQLKDLGSPDPDTDGRDIVYFPCGDHLDFARSLGIEEITPSLEKFKAIVSNRCLIEIPVMQCNGRRFINMARVGSLAEVDEETLELKKVLSRATLPYRITYDVNGGLDLRSFETLGFVVAQGLYGLGGLKLSTQEMAFKDDSFEFLTIRGNRHLEAMRTLLSMQEEEGFNSAMDIVSVKTQSLSITSSTPMPINLDGDIFIDYNFQFSRDGGKLRFLLH